MKGTLKSKLKRHLQTEIKNKLETRRKWKGNLEPVFKRNLLNRNVKGMLQSECEGNFETIIEKEL